MRLVLITTLLLLTSACGYQEAEEAVRGRLRDPFSVQFKAVGGRGDIVCGYVNARNGFGAYTGFRKFAYDYATKGLYLDTGRATEPNHDILLRCRNVSSEYLQMNTEDLRSATDELWRLQRQER